MTSPPAIRQENVTHAAKRRLLTSHFTLHTALPAAGHERELRMKGTQITENLIKEKKTLCNKKKPFPRIENFKSITTTNKEGPTYLNEKKLF